MGCKESRKENKISFDDPLTERLRRLFDRLQNRYPLTAKTDYICQESLEYLHDGRPELGAKLYQFMLKHSTTAKVDFENFLPIVEILVEEPSSYHLQNYRALDKMEILFLISMQRLTIEDPDYKQQKVSYLEALQFLQDVEYISVKSGLALNQRYASDESVARSILSSIYPTSSGSVEWWSLVLFFKQMMPHLTEQVKTFYKYTFLTTNPPKILPRFAKPSYLLNSQQFIYLALGNAYIKSASSVGLLWSNAHYGWNFESLFRQLMSYDGPTLLLLRFSNDTNESIIGAFNKKKWIDSGSYQSNEECYLFQLTPKFKVFAAQRFKRTFANESDANTQNYAYMHYFDEKVGDTKALNELAPSGVGFGGQDNKYRLWVDHLDMQKRSYVMTEDDTYKKGSLIDPVMTNYQLSYMEVWAIGKEVDMLSTQLLVEKASYLESHYLRSQMRVHKEMITMMKDNLQGENPNSQSRIEEAPPLRQSGPMNQSRKAQILNMVDPAAQAAYEPNARVTATSLIRNRSVGGKSYIRPGDVDGDLGFGNTTLFRGTAPPVQEVEEPEAGYRKTQLMRSSYQP